MVKIGSIAGALKQAKAAGTLEQSWIDFLEKQLDFKWDIKCIFWWNAIALRRWAVKTKLHRQEETLK